MVGYNTRKLLLIALCASIAGTAVPVQGISIRIPVKTAKPRARTNQAHGAFKTTFITSLKSIKKLVTFEYLRHCDCPNHKKNQTLKNQIRRHPERLAAYTAAGIGILFGAYKLFFEGRPHVAPVPPVPGEVPGHPVGPNAPIRDESDASSDLEELSSNSSDDDNDNQPDPGSHLHAVTYDQLLRQKEECIRREQQAARRHIPVPLEVDYVIVEPPVLHRIESAQNGPRLQNPIQRVFPAYPIRGTLINVAKLQKPASITGTHPSSPLASSGFQMPSARPVTPSSADLERPRANSKGKEELSESDEQSSQQNSFIMVSSVHGKLKTQLSEPLQNLIQLSSHDIPHEQGNPYDSENLFLLGAACNHALITNDEKAIAHFAKNHVQSVRALTWYYYALAAGKQQFFQEGTFLISHPRAHVILDFLNKDTIKNRLPSIARVENAYERISSHFDKFMKLLGKKEQHYGIDIDCLPTNKQTLLFGHVAQDQNLMFIKPENHGTNTASDLAHHAKGYAESVHTKAMAAIHGGPSGDDAPEYRKERVPTEILNLFKVMNDGLFMQGLITLEHRQAKYTEAQARGIAYMHAEATRCLNSLEQEPALKAQAEALLARMNQYDHLNLRFGREVILTERELNFITQEDYNRLMEYILALPVLE